MKVKTKKGKDAINQVLSVVSRVLKNNPKGKELLMEDPSLEQRLAYYICRELGLICQFIESDNEKDWMQGCLEAPRGRGYCLYHYQKKFQRYVFDTDNNNKRREKKKK